MRTPLHLPNRQIEKAKFAPNSSPPPKPKRGVDPRWSHQVELEAMRGKRVLVQSCSGRDELGTLLEADQFTVKLMRVDGTGPVILFKSEIRSIEEKPVV